MPEHASQLYARNVQALLELLLGEDGDAGPGLRRRGRRRRLRRARRRGGRAPDARSPTWRSSCWPASSASLVISKVPNTLHTPLMSGTNAIHGIVVLGGILVLGLRGRRLPQQAPAGHRDRLRHDQRRRRLPGHRPHARDVQGASRRRRSRGDRRRRRSVSRTDVVHAALHRRLLAVHLRADGADGPAHGGARQPHRGGRHGDRGRRDAADPGDGQLGPDHPRRRDRHRGRRPRRAQGEDDRDAADGGAVQRRRRRRGRADRVGRVPPDAAASRTSRPTSRSSACFAAIVGSVSFWGSNIAFGKLQEILPGRPITIGPGARSSSSTSRCCWSRSRARVAIVGRLGRRDPDDRAAARGGGARQLRRAADRRRRHAGRDLAAQRVHRPAARRRPASR